MRGDRTPAVVNVSLSINKSVVFGLLISPRTVTVVGTAVVIVVVVSELLICPATGPVVAIAVAVVDEADCELLISLGKVTVAATTLAVFVDVVGNISVVIITNPVILGTSLVDTCGVVVVVISVLVLVTIVAGCTELNSVGIDDTSDDNASVER